MGRKIFVGNLSFDTTSADLEGLFAKFGGGGLRTGKAGLGLYFCRITAERWAGEVGHRPLTPKGASFYLRLPARLEV